MYDAYPYVTHQNGADCVGPRWGDPVTDQEVNGLVWKWGSSTVMDYPGDQTQDMNDLGLYDKAAVRFGYANVVDVDVNAGEATLLGQFNLNRGTSQIDGFGGISGPLDFTTVSGTQGGFHYSALQDTFNVLGTCTKATDSNNPLTATCTGMPLNYYSYYDMRDIPGTSPSYFALAPNNSVRHPYMFGSDEFAGLRQRAGLPLRRWRGRVRTRAVHLDHVREPLRLRQLPAKPGDVQYGRGHRTRARSLLRQDHRVDEVARVLLESHPGGQGFPHAERRHDVAARARLG